MGISKKNRELLFWVLQLIGWGMINSLIFLFPFGFSKTYTFYSFIVATFIGIIITSIYRLYLRRYINLEDFDKKSVIRLILAFGICALAYYMTTSFSEWVYDQIWTRTETEIGWIKEHITIPQMIFSISMYIFGWTLLYFAIKLYMRANQNNIENLELKATLREAQLNTLKGQVNPHFMFNSLNNIRGLMLEDVNKSREMITKLSGMLQYALSKNTVDAIALEEELEMVENYIALSKIQMEDRLVFTKDIAPETLLVSIPPMIIQLLVENAAKHGISNLKNGGVILLKTTILNKELHILVSNTGKLRISKKSTQLGLKNIKQRLRLLYGNKASFSLVEVGDTVEATLKIPLV